MAEEEHKGDADVLIARHLVFFLFEHDVEVAVGEVVAGFAVGDISCALAALLLCLFCCVVGGRRAVFGCFVLLVVAAGACRLGGGSIVRLAARVGLDAGFGTAFGGLCGRHVKMTAEIAGPVSPASMMGSVMSCALVDA